ncbi:MAG: hypothetical protein WAW33_02910, partial [Minisyncoccia bacterium]
MNKVKIPKVKNTQKWSAILKQTSQILFLVLVVAFLISSFSSKGQNNSITLSELAQKINLGEISKINVTSTDIT